MSKTKVTVEIGLSVEKYNMCNFCKRHMNVVDGVAYMHIANGEKPLVKGHPICVLDNLPRDTAHMKRTKSILQKAPETVEKLRIAQRKQQQAIAKNKREIKALNLRNRQPTIHLGNHPARRRERRWIRNPDTGLLQVTWV